MGWKRIVEKQPEEQPSQLPQLPPLKPMPKKEIPVAPKEVYEVVLKIPTQEIRRMQREDGTIINYITVEEFQLMKMTNEANQGE